jgi:hypothetical protein
MSPYHGTVEAIRGHAYNVGAARTASRGAHHFHLDFLARLEIHDFLFLHQNLLEMFRLMAMFVVHLGMGHSLLAKSIKSRMIHKYIAEAASIIVKCRQIHQPDEVPSGPAGVVSSM